MKYYSKFLLLTVSLFCGMMTFAQTTAVRISLTAEDDEYIHHELMVTQDSKYNATKQDGDELPLGDVRFPNVSMFVEMPYGKFTSICTNALLGTKISFYTGKYDKYTLTFSGQKGEVLYLRDTKTGNEIKMVESSQPYHFMLDANEVSSKGNQKIVYNRFEIVNPSTPQPTDYTICYRNGYLQISNYPTDKNTDHIVIKDADGKIVKDEAPKAIYHEIDLRNLTKGHYTIKANGEVLTIGVQ